MNSYSRRTYLVPLTPLNTIFFTFHMVYYFDFFSFFCCDCYMFIVFIVFLFKQITKLEAILTAAYCFVAHINGTNNWAFDEKVLLQSLYKVVIYKE